MAQADHASQLTKSSAILGGQMSALDRITQDQQPAAYSPELAKSPLLPSSRESKVVARALDFTGTGLVPGIGGSSCVRFSLPKTVPQSGVGRMSNNDDFLLTRRLPVSQTAFDGEWGRVSAGGLSARYVRRLLPGEFRNDQVNADTLLAVNAWANKRIRYVEDVKLFGRADYWAGARTTLRLKAGDCEDIAITKLQILAAMGVARSDLFLTIARDLARHADHALLVVRMNGRFWVLDNATDQLIDANERLDYQPVLSFSANRKWLHGTVSLAMK